MEIIIIGALINAGAILAGGGVGLLLKGKISDKFAQSIVRVIGLCVCIIGISGALGGDVMLLVISLTLGTVAGEFLSIDEKLNNFGLWVQSKVSRGDEKSTFAEGFVTTSLLYCVGAMAIVGSLDSGLRNDQSVVIIKAILDGTSAIIFASSLGFGVLFSAFAVLIYQGTIEFFAVHLQNVFTDNLILQISAVGGIMIMGLGANLVLGAKIKIANMLPGFIFAVGYYYLFVA